MPARDERTALCALNRVFGYRPALGHTLMARCGSAAAVFRETESGLLELLGAQGKEYAAQLTEAQLEWAETELERIRDGGFRFIGFGEKGYPPLLLECPDPPIGLYFNGCSPPEEVFGDTHPCIAVVGTRDLSPYGKDWCRRMVTAMSEASVRPCIVSGLAFGADGIAHKTALQCGLPTVGVMATGIERIYPWQHTELAGKMVRTRGCAVVTDYPAGTSPVALNFIRRNRIIAGLARATVVIESKTKGGSLITARYACDYNRDVYALPGRADDMRSGGCNSLIRERMADIITNAGDLVDRLGLGRPARIDKTGLEALLAREYGPSSPLVTLGLLVRSRPGITLEEIGHETGWSWAEVLERTGMLETGGFLETDLLQRCTIQAKNV